MLIPAYTKQFKRDLKLIQRRGKNASKIKGIIDRLIDEKPLANKFRDHKLIGNFQYRRECHIEPDWLLVYVVEADRIIFERTGTHTDLFK